MMSRVPFLLPGRIVSHLPAPLMQFCLFGSLQKQQWWSSCQQNSSFSQTLSFLASSVSSLIQCLYVTEANLLPANKDTVIPSLATTEQAHVCAVFSVGLRMARRLCLAEFERRQQHFSLIRLAGIMTSNVRMRQLWIVFLMGVRYCPLLAMCREG